MHPCVAMHSPMQAATNSIKDITRQADSGRYTISCIAFSQHLVNSPIHVPIALVKCLDGRISVRETHVAEGCQLVAVLNFWILLLRLQEMSKSLAEVGCWTQ